MAQDAREFDIIVLGATGYTGKITCKYLDSLKAAAGKWAMAGRDAAKLQALKQSLHAGDGVPTITVDLASPESLDALCKRAVCVLSCAGPFTAVGMPVVEACVRNGTHYVDSTGEYNFVRRVAEKFHATATGAGIALVSCCGFDSVPSDIGNYVLHARAGETVTDVKCFYAHRSGGFSSGTMQSILALAADATAADASPTSLLPAEAPQPRATPRQRGVWYDAAERTWTAPFAMAATNERVVRRSNALRGSTASYMECEEGSFAHVMRATFGGVAMKGVMAVAPLRRYLVNKKYPAQASIGPSDEHKAAAYFRGRFVGTTASGKRVVCTVGAQRDAYDVTGVFLGESALSAVALARQRRLKGGVLTPSVAFGDEFVRRLVAAGITIAMGDDRIAPDAPSISTAHADSSAGDAAATK